MALQHQVCLCLCRRGEEPLAHAQGQQLNIIPLTNNSSPTGSHPKTRQDWRAPQLCAAAPASPHTRLASWQRKVCQLMWLRSLRLCLCCGVAGKREALALPRHKSALEWSRRGPVIGASRRRQSVCGDDGGPIVPRLCRLQIRLAHDNY